MFTAQVYKVAVLSLSGIMEEVYTAQEVIRKDNQENAERTGKLFLPLAGDATASDSDVVIGIVGNYIEKAEVIEEAVEGGEESAAVLQQVSRSGEYNSCGGKGR